MDLLSIGLVANKNTSSVQPIRTLFVPHLFTNLALQSNAYPRFSKNVVDEELFSLGRYKSELNRAEFLRLDQLS